MKKWGQARSEHDDVSGSVKANSGRLMRIIDFSDRVVNYAYKDDTGDLWKVEITANNPKDEVDNRVITYDYYSNSTGDLKLAHNLKSILDPKGQTALTINYDEEDKVTSHDSGGSLIAYNLSKTSPTVIDARNNEKKYTLNEDGHIESITEDTSIPPTSFQYNNGLIRNVTFPRANSMAYDYNEGILTTITESPGPDDTPDAEYPVEPGKVTSFNYEEFTKNLLSITYPNSLKQNYAYNEYGQVTSEATNLFYEGQDTPLGQTLFYEYHPESIPGGIETTRESTRLLNSTTGGYLKRSTSSFGEIQDTDNWGYWENYVHDQRGNLSGMNSFDGINAQYQTNIFDQVINESITSKVVNSFSPISYTGNYNYDKNGNLKEETTSSGSLTRSSTFNYDLRNNLLTANDSLQGLTALSYDANDNVTSISGAEGTIGFSYDNRDLVQSVTKGDYTFGFTHDANGNIKTFTDPFGHVTTYGYDGYDRIQSVKDPLNNMTLLARAQFGNLLSVKQLDSAQNLLFKSIKISDPLGQLTSYSIKMPDNEDINYKIVREDNGRIVKFIDPIGRESIIEKNQDGRTKKMIDAAGNMIEYFYEDGRGNVTRKVKTVKSTGGDKTEIYETKYVYNAHNKLERIIDPQGYITEFFYDKMGNLTGTKDAEGNKITQEYDDSGRRTKMIRWIEIDGILQPITTTFEYYPKNTYNPGDNSGQFSPSNRLKSITDEKGNKTNYEYDSQNRLTKIIYPDESYVELTYDRVGAGTNPAGETIYYRLVIEKQRNGTIVKHYFDQLQRLMKREIILAGESEGTTLETFEYDGLSRINKAVDNDSELNFAYDRASRLDWEKRADKLIDYSYDKLGNIQQIKYPNSRLFVREFDKLNRMNLIREGDFTIAEMKHIGRSYRLLRKQYGNGDLIQYLYDQGRRLTYKETINKNSDLINHYKYGYNKVHMKTYEQRLHDSGKGNVMDYDALYRLSKMKFNVPDPTIENTTEFDREKTIKFDQLDNILSMVENFDDQTKTITTDIPADSDYSKLNQYAYFDQWGLSYDKNGNTIQKGPLHLSYDYRNQIVKATDTTTYTQVEMKYDVLGRRIQKAVNSNGQQMIENYYYSGHQLIEVRDENDQILRQYIYGNGIDEIIRMDIYSGDAVTSYYFHTDSNGSVTAITDANGQLLERVTYDIYGMPKFWDADGNEIPKSSIGNNILFHGREYDYELNLYYFRARYYCPIMGRFLSTDPMGFTDSMNLYQGFNMNPVNFVDPFGRNREWIEGQNQPEIFALESKLYELQLSMSLVNDQVELAGVYGEYLKLNEIYNQKTGKYFIEKKTEEPIMTMREGYAMVMGFTPAGDADDITVLFANYSILEGKKVELNLVGKGVALIGVALPFVKTKLLLKVAKLFGLENFFLKAQKKISKKLNKNRLQSGHIGNPPRHIRKNIKDIEAWDEIETFLGNSRSTDINPFTGVKDPNRIFVQQADGTWRSVRIGAHEMGKKIGSGFHYHLEEWTSNGNLVRPDQSVNVLKTSKER